MKFECVRAVSMRCLLRQVSGQINDINSIERTFLYADTATNAEGLREVCNLRVSLNFDAHFTGSHHRTVILTFLLAFLWLASVWIDDSDTKALLVIVVIVFIFFAHIGSRKKQ